MSHKKGGRSGYYRKQQTVAPIASCLLAHTRSSFPTLRPLPPLPPFPGKRQDNRAASRPGSMHKKGFRFFADDEDMYGLEDILQARPH